MSNEQIYFVLGCRSRCGCGASYYEIHYYSPCRLLAWEQSRTRGQDVCEHAGPRYLQASGSLSDVRASPFVPWRVVKREQQFQGARSASVRSMSIGCDLPNA